MVLSVVGGGGLGVRHGQATILFVCVGLAYALRVNLSVGIVAMVDNTTSSGIQTVEWSAAEKGTILGSFFWGYLVTNIPAGILSRTLGARLLLGCSMILNGLTTVLLPLVAVHWGVVGACAFRVLQGLGQGFVYPSCNTMMSKWAVPQERSRMYGFVFGGGQIGTIVMMVAAGYLATSSWGWPSIFYISGSLSILWGFVCFWLTSDAPEKHGGISKEERIFIENSMVSVAQSKPDVRTPWLDMATSVPFLSLFLVHVAQNWGYWTLLTLIPTYLADVRHFDIKENGFLSALPYLVMWICAILFPAIADMLLTRGIFTPGTSRKFWNSIALYGGAAALTLLALVKTDTVWAMVLLVLAVGLNAGTYAGYLLNHLDLSPNFAGTLMGVTNGLANISSILAPTIAGLITVHQGDESEWSTVFLIAAGMFVLGQTIFNVFGSGEIQPWNEGADWREKQEDTPPTLPMESKRSTPASSES